VLVSFIASVQATQFSAERGCILLVEGAAVEKDSLIARGAIGAALDKVP
jgi:hypothetical protein